MYVLSFDSSHCNRHTTLCRPEATGDVQLRASANDPKQIEPDTVTLMVEVEEIGQKTVSISLLDATSGAELASIDKIEVTTVL